MTTFTDNRPQVRITPEAFKQASAIVTWIKQQGYSASRTAWISELILAQPLPNGEKPTAALRLEVGYCPDCQMLIPTDEKVCSVCGTLILSMLALPAGELLTLENALQTRHHLDKEARRVSNG